MRPHITTLLACILLFTACTYEFPDKTVSEDSGTDTSVTCEGCWVDPVGGRMWQNPPHDTPLDWNTAVTYCDSLVLNGYGPGDWYLPSISDTRTLFRGCTATENGGTCGVTDTCNNWSCTSSDCTACSPMSGPRADGCYLDSALTGTCSTCEWTSTYVADDTDTAWHIDLTNAGVYYAGRLATCTVRCVRR